MKNSIAAVLFSFIAVVAIAQQESPATNSTGMIKLRAKVMAMHQLGEFSGTVLPVDFDARFALMLRIDAAVPPVPELNPGTEVTFAILSPTRAFGRVPKRGKTYNFVLCREVVKGKATLSGLGVQVKGGSLGTRG